MPAPARPASEFSLARRSRARWAHPRGARTQAGVALPAASRGLDLVAALPAVPEQPRLRAANLIQGGEQCQ